MKIAIVDDSRDETKLLESQLDDLGVHCDYFSSGEAFIAALRCDTFDAVLLDWNMVGMSGMEVLTWMRGNLDRPPPVLMMTNRDSKSDIVAALEAGGADYICKPEDALVVRARISAAVRQYAIPLPKQLETYGGFTFDDAARTVAFGGAPIELRQKEYALAKLLFENLNRPLSRGYILERVWHCSPNVETRTLDVHVSKLRSMLGLRPDRGLMLQTVFGFGYRLMLCSSMNMNESLAS